MVVSGMRPTNTMVAFEDASSSMRKNTFMFLSTHNLDDRCSRPVEPCVPSWNIQLVERYLFELYKSIYIVFAAKVTTFLSLVPNNSEIMHHRSYCSVEENTRSAGNKQGGKAVEPYREIITASIVKKKWVCLVCCWASGALFHKGNGTQAIAADMYWNKHWREVPLILIRRDGLSISCFSLLRNPSESILSVGIWRMYSLQD